MDAIAARPWLIDDATSASVHRMRAWTLRLSDPDAALDEARRAVGTYRRLADLAPGRFADHLANSLGILGSLLDETGRNAGAVRAWLEAAQIQVTVPGNLRSSQLTAAAYETAAARRSLDAGDKRLAAS